MEVGSPNIHMITRVIKTLTNSYVLVVHKTHHHSKYSSCTHISTWQSHNPSLLYTVSKKNDTDV